MTAIAVNSGNSMASALRGRSALGWSPSEDGAARLFGRSLVKSVRMTPVAMSLLLVAQPGLAQSQVEQETGSRIGRPKPADNPDREGLSPIDRARIVVDEFATCTLLRDGRKAAAYRDLKYDDAKGTALLDDIVSNYCLREGMLRMPNNLLRGAIFKAFYKRDIKKSQVSFQETPLDFTIYVTDMTAPAAQRYVILMDFVDCVVRADPERARIFTLSVPGSPEENEALAALQPRLGPCLVNGANVTFNKSSLSAMLAEALYREAMAAPANIAEASH